MSNQAMKAARGDVLGREVEPAIRRRRGQSRRNLQGKRALFTQRHGRLHYRGTTRSRDTKVMPGHPLAGLWGRWQNAVRSHRPDVRRHAHKQLGNAGRTYPVWVDEAVGMPL